MKHRIHLLLNLLVALTIVLPWGAYFRPVAALPAGDEKSSSDTGIYRTSVTLPNSTARARLDELGVTVLAEGVDTAIVLATAGQLETLARLRFQPQTSDDLGLLVEANRDSKPWLLASLSSALATTRQAQAALDNDALTAEQAEATAQAVLDGLTPEQEAGILGAASVDDDADGLTNTQEEWWCTDPLNPDSDGDGANDGFEVQAAKHWLANAAPSYPTSGKPFVGWPPNHPNCYDDDSDSIPDLAERWELGLNMNQESTDRDKYDDGQELFGLTYCTGQGGFCSYGLLPRNADWGVITAGMPSWVRRPGNHPLVAAYPVPEIDVVPSSLHVEAVTTITTDHVITTGEEHSYSTAVTEGKSTAVADTVTWNNWEEVSHSLESPVSGLVEFEQSSLSSHRNFLENIKGPTGVRVCPRIT